MTGPTWHVRPTAGWLNDPNGPIRHAGRYHVFFQHNPHAAVHDRIHWGHASSADLVTWRAEPVALVPTPGGPDEAGVWSGCATDDAGTPTAVYSGVRDRSGVSAICLATADDPDLRTWKQDPQPVVDPPTGLAGFRDPFLVVHRGRRLAVVGAGEPDGTPFLAVYDATDLRDWRPLGRLLDGRDPVAARHAPADIWECPALVELDGRWVLVVSLWRGGQLCDVSWLAGELTDTPDGPRLRPDRGGTVDGGSDFYAPTTLRDGPRTLLWGWSWESGPPDAAVARGWAGVLACPRELFLADDGTPALRPARELTALRRRELTTRRVSANGAATVLLDALPAAAEVDLTVPDGLSVELVLRRGPGRELVVAIAPGRVAVRRGDWPTVAPRRAAAVDTPGRAVRVLLDDSVVEVFADDRTVITERVDHLDGDRGVLELRPTSPADRNTADPAVVLTAWELAPPTPA